MSFGDRPIKARVIHAIEIEILHSGEGTIEDPENVSYEYWDFDGNLLARSKMGARICTSKMSPEKKKAFLETLKGITKGSK